MMFQDDISNMNTYTHTHTYIRTSRNQYVPHFFKVGGITRSPKRASRLHKTQLMFFITRYFEVVQGFFLVSSGAEIRPLSQLELGDFFPDLKKKNPNLKFFFFFFFFF